MQTHCRSKPSDCHPPGLKVAGKFIIDLVNGLENKGHIICCDNYYTSPSGFLDVMKPNCVDDYNENMGGPDLADQCFQYYSPYT